MIGTLLALRARLWWRRLAGERRWGTIAIALVAACAGAMFSFACCQLVLARGAELSQDPSLAARGGPLRVFASWLTMALVCRVFFALTSLGRQTFLDPRRFRGFPVPARVISAVNVAALFADPVWLLIYPPLVAIAAAVSRMPAGPALWALLAAETLSVWATVGVMHLGEAVAAYFDSRAMLRRGFLVVLLLVAFAGFQLSIAHPDRAGVAALLASKNWRAIAWTPPGWSAALAGDLSAHRVLHALLPLVLLFLLGLACSVAAHELSRREAIRPPEPVQGAARGSGWRLPLLPGAFSALFEKEAKTIVRAGWLQLVVVPVAYLLLVRTWSGPEPLLLASVYSQVGVLEVATNAFGRDLLAARANFLWPVSLRELFFAKNAVAYCFSLAIFLLLSLVAWTSARVTSVQVAVALLAHLAIFPLVATFGNAVSVLFPMPVRGARLRRVRGAGPIGARLFVLLLLSGAAWAPYAVARATGLPLLAAYTFECVALWTAYLALLGASARLLQSKRETLLSALSRDE